MSFLLTYDTQRVVDKHNGGYIYYPLINYYKDNNLIEKRVVKERGCCTIISCLKAGKQFCEEERKSLFKRNLPNLGKVLIAESGQKRLDKYRSFYGDGGGKVIKNGALRGVRY